MNQDQRNALAYIAGALHGDAYSGTKFGLTAIDKDFVEAFAEAAVKAVGLTWRVRPTRERYWCVEASNTTGRFSHLRHFEPETTSEVASWLRAWFDAEGNAYWSDDVGKLGYTFRKICGVSTEMATIEKVAGFLDVLGIRTRILSRNKPSAGHYGDKIVHEVALRGREDFEKFSVVVGSSIKRKREIIEKIVGSFKGTEGRRTAQLKGAEVRRVKTLTTVLPKVIEALKERVANDESLTTRACGSIPGYYAVRHYHSHSELLEMAA